MKPELNLFPVPKKVRITDSFCGKDCLIEENIECGLPEEGYRLVVYPEGIWNAGGTVTGMCQGP